MTQDVRTAFDAVRDLAPVIGSRSAEIESARRLPPDLLAQLIQAGVFRWFVPKKLGGQEIDFPSSMELIEILARADGSTGWVVMIGCETPMLLALLSPERFDGLYADGPDLIIAGGFAPRGQATLADGQFRVTGRWGFASGCEHARWLFGNCVVKDANGPAESSEPPTLRAMMFARERATIIDTWSVSGLRGTGSHDIAVEDAVVPERDSFDIFRGRSSIPGPIFAAPLLYAALHIGAVAIGIAQRAVDEIVALAVTNKRRLYTSSALADNPLFQYRLANAETSVRAARNLIRSEADAVWSAAQSARLVPPAEVSRVLGTTTWVAHTCAAAVDACYSAGGGSSPYAASPLQRCLRDIHTLTQHAAVGEAQLSRAGAALLGRDSAVAP